MRDPNEETLEQRAARIAKLNIVIDPKAEEHLSQDTYRYQTEPLTKADTFYPLAFDLNDQEAALRLAKRDEEFDPNLHFDTSDLTDDDDGNLQGSNSDL